MLHPQLRDLLLAEEFDRDSKVRSDSNLLSFDLVLWTNVPVCVLLVVSQLLIGTQAAMWAGLVWLVVDACILVWRYLLHGTPRHPTRAIYALFAFMMVMGILMGTVLDTHNTAFTIFVLFALYPFAIYDRPRRVLVTFFCWVVAFIVLALTVKEPGVREVDVFDAAEFVIMSVVSALVAGALRLDAMRRHRELRRKYEHDATTGLPNRTLMERHLGALVGEDVCCVCVELQNRSFYYVMLGYDTGDAIVSAFAHKVEECFGAEGHVYQTANDTFMVVARVSLDQGDDWAIARLRHLQDLSSQVPVGPNRRGVSFTAGYELAHVESVDTMRLVMRSAGVDCIQAGYQSSTGIVGHYYKAQRNLEVETRRTLASVARGSMGAPTQDTLTGLLNVQSFFASGRQLLTSIVDFDRGPVAAYVNIVSMKAINARYGFERGDAIIRSAGQALREAFPNRIVARSDADHFIGMIYEDELPVLQAALGMVERDERMPGLFKVGVCPIERNLTLAQACDRARIACGRITHRPNRALATYDKAMGDEALRRYLVISALGPAIQNGNIKLYLQPVVDVQTRKVCGAEALCRWDDPKLGFMTPDKFIEVLEQERLITRLDYHMAELAVQTLAKRREAGLLMVPVSINLARQDLVEGDVCGYLEGLLEHYGIPRTMLAVEVTERDVAESAQEVLACVDKLRSHGFEVWMDDFGSEYSSLNMLESCQFDVIKLDMGFMREYASNMNSHVVVKSVVGLVKHLGARTLAEGVENETQLSFLRKEAKCDCAQGYLFSKPLPVDDRGLVEGEAEG